MIDGNFEQKPDPNLEALKKILESGLLPVAVAGVLIVAFFS